MTSSVRRRVATVAVAWGAGASAAVAVGLIALSLIGDGLGVHPVDQLAPGTPGQALPLVVPRSSAPTRPTGSPAPAGKRTWSSPTPTGPPTGAPSPAPSVGEPVPISSRGGTVVAQCVNTTAYLVSWSPAQDYRMGEVHRGPVAWASATFVSAQYAVTVWATCQSGTMQARVTVGTDSGPDDH